MDWHAFTKLNTPINLNDIQFTLHLPGTEVKTESTLTVQHFLGIMILISWVVGIAHYCFSLMRLHHYIRQAFTFKNQKNIRILFHDQVQSPFCFYLFKNYIVLPAQLLEKIQQFNVALYHEHQHIRHRDPLWSHMRAWLTIFFFLNPMIRSWRILFSELQELACDEAFMKKQKCSSESYVRCLLAAVKYAQSPLSHVTVNMHDSPQSLLFRRVNMILNFTSIKTRKKYITPLCYAFSIFVASSTACALNVSGDVSLFDTQQMKKLIQQSHIHSSFHVQAEPETILELNQIRNDQHSRDFFKASLNRMKQHERNIVSKLDTNHLPHELLVVPLVESGVGAVI